MCENGRFLWSRPPNVRLYLLFLSTEYYSDIIQKIGMQVYSYGYQ